MKNWMKFLLWCFLFTGVTVILFFEHKKESLVTLNNPEIKIAVLGKDTFLTQQEVLNRLQTHQIFEIGKEVSTLDIFETEATLDTMPEVRNVDVYKGLKGSWSINLELVKPVARVFPTGAKSFYLDADGNKMGRSSIHTARVLIFSGDIPDRIDSENINLIINNDSLKSIRLLDDIYRISNYVCKDPLLQSLIGQVYCDKNHEFIMIPVVGKQKIVFGKARSVKEVEEKFQRLKVFYQEAMPFEGWNKYSEISLKYEGQVVCRKAS
jgi:cell division protein FtsQ